MTSGERDCPLPSGVVFAVATAAWFQVVVPYTPICIFGDLFDRGHICADQCGGLLVHVALATIGMVVLEVCESGSRGDRVDVVVAVVVKRHMEKRVVGQSENDVAHIGGRVGGDLVEHVLDSALVLIGGFR